MKSLEKYNTCAKIVHYYEFVRKTKEKSSIAVHME